MSLDFDEVLDRAVRHAKRVLAGEEVDWETIAAQRAMRIAQLERTVAEATEQLEYHRGLHGKSEAALRELLEHPSPEKVADTEAAFQRGMQYAARFMAMTLHGMHSEVNRAGAAFLMKADNAMTKAIEVIEMGQTEKESDDLAARLEWEGAEAEKAMDQPSTATHRRTLREGAE